MRWRSYATSCCAMPLCSRNSVDVTRQNKMMKGSPPSACAGALLVRLYGSLLVGGALPNTECFCRWGRGMCRKQCVWLRSTTFGLTSTALELALATFVARSPSPPPESLSCAGFDQLGVWLGGLRVGRDARWGGFGFDHVLRRCRSSPCGYNQLVGGVDQT